MLAFLVASFLIGQLFDRLCASVFVSPGFILFVVYLSQGLFLLNPVVSIVRLQHSELT